MNKRYSNKTRTGQLQDAETDLARARRHLASLPAPREDDAPIVASRRHRAEQAVALLTADVEALRAGKPIA